MNIIKRNIPNILTLTNLTSGLFATLFAISGDLELAAICIFIGVLFDFSDGFVARILKANSELGKQLDSLADLISFGVAPGMILFQLIHISITSEKFLSTTDLELSTLYPTMVAFLIPIFSAIRLGKFNLDTSQSSVFIGLPTPASAIIIYQFPNYILDTSILLIISIILPTLLIAKLHLFSLKMNKKEQLYSQLNIFRMILIISAIILFYYFVFAAIPFIVILYIILSLLNNML